MDPFSNTIEDLYSTYKPHLFSIAYRMLGSRADAEDMVQDLFISIYDYLNDNITNIKSYLSKMMVNRCLNELKSARKQRISYVGNWLPEPTVQLIEDSPLEIIERQESISYGFLILMDKLTPLERAVFILKEVLAYEHGEIGEILNKSEVNCRKIFSRVKKKIDLSSVKHDVQSTYLLEKNELVTRFIAAISNGQIQSLVEMLTEDVILIADGGGKVSAATHPISNRARVLDILRALSINRFPESKAQLIEVNNQPGILLTKEGIPTGVICFEWDALATSIQRIYIIVNPDKITALIL
ncbi:sigma-70 family RNA polymerase sigma factor [Paenibacillus sp. HWE-109]|uniref:sigma-70 family RNA polymerase sigma factor n=1 Tax=Paenibacillus sp. HWE-109 TaxID=1306526 RepID=UPI001EDEE82A|nr:sigma-70 family RNA polymerase sigma factor [Paenibacillus sp. HWE-109]UKS29388.1 sigma-70 family RNA polymerase sigma factor [Paenibacillus sp. HWE-109]